MTASTETVAGGGPNAGDIAATFVAAAPDSYGSETLDDADTADVVTSLDEGRPFRCTDVVVYFHQLDVSASAASGSATVTLVTEFDSAFSGGGTGFADVEATLATADSGWVAGGDESIATHLEPSTSGEPMQLTVTIGGVDAGEHLVVEYRATLGCDPTDPPSGELAATPTELSVSDGGGASTQGDAGRPVVLASGQIDLTPADCTPYIEGNDGPLVLPEGCQEVSTARAVAPGAVDNPTMSGSCGIRMMVIVDRSGSIASAGATQTVRDALTAFINTLNNTGSDVAIVDFSTTATLAIPYTTLNSSTVGTFNNYISNYNPSGNTNWDDALYLANQGAPNLTLFITDGQPNTNSGQSAHGGVHPTGISATNQPLYFAAKHSDSIKAGGSHIFVVGVGAATSHTFELSAVSGNNPGTNVATNDYTTVTTFAALAASLRSVVFSLCSSSVTVTKLIDGQPASGWGIIATINSVATTPASTTFQFRNPTATATPPASRTVTTGANGTAKIEWALGSAATPLPGTANVTLSEVAQPGLVFGTGTCKIESETAGARTVTFTSLPANIGDVQHDAFVTCTFENLHIVTPVNPVVTNATCVNGAVTTPTVTPPSTTGITYTVSPTPPNLPGQTVTVTATANTGSRLVTPLPTGWTAVGANAQFTVTLAAASCTTATPVNPVVVQATCSNGIVTVPTVTPATTTGITYTLSPAAPYFAGQTVTVTATVNAGFAWPANMPAGWTRVSASTATFTVNLAATTCPVATPQNPSVVQAACTGGVLHAPTVTAATTANVTYAFDPAGPYTAGQTIAVIATVAQGFGWPATMPAGWTRVNPTTARYSLTFASVACVPVVPVPPVVTQASCVNGTVTAPTVTPAAAPTGVSYVVTPGGPYDGTVTNVVTVTATLSNGQAWGQMPSGWIEADPTTATYSVTLAAASCTSVTPVAPRLTQAVCVNGALVPPSLALVPTDGITYTVAPPGPYSPGQQVVVTATLNASGVAWPDPLPTGWVRVSTTTATYTVTFLVVACVPVVPADPSVTQASCVSGAVTAPVVTAATVPEGVNYSLAPPGPYDGTVTTPVTVTAKLADGFSWGQMPLGWTRVDNTTATRPVILTAAACTQVTPVAPSLTQAACVDGAVTAPTLTLATTDRIAYTALPSGPYSAGQQVTVSAVLVGSGVGWPPTLPPGWTKTSATTATYIVRFADASCTPVVPVDPVTTQATCASGAVTAPSVVLATTPAGVSYVAVPAGPYVGTVTTVVTITATLADGFEWGVIPTGWTETSNSTATFTVTLAAASCAQVSPVAPTVTDAVCTSGVVTTPTLELGFTDGITYQAAPGGPYAPGDEVTVTATLRDTGVGWPATLPPVWTRTSATEATFAVVFADVSCIPVTPVATPTFTEGVCANGVFTAPTLTVPSGTGLVYTTSAPPPYASGQTVVLSATVQEGYGWDTARPAGWVFQNDVLATFTVRFQDVECRPATPVAPTVTDASCVNGEVTVPTLELATTDGITYTASPGAPYSPGQSVTVTATLADGFEWGQLARSWTELTPTTATYVVTFAPATCAEVVPALPTVTEAVCAGGVVVPPSLELADTDGITYTAVPGPPYHGGQEVTVTATLDDTGVAWPPTLPAGWLRTSSTTAVHILTFGVASCVPASPAGPTVTQATCSAGAVTDPDVVAATEPAGVSYDRLAATTVRRRCRQHGRRHRHPHRRFRMGPTARRLGDRGSDDRDLHGRARPRDVRDRLPGRTGDRTGRVR